MLKCVKCGSDDMCNDPCDKCGKHKCVKCMFTCRICGKTLCNICTKRNHCNICNADFCSECFTSCSRCLKPMCNTCFIEHDENFLCHKQ